MPPLSEPLQYLSHRHLHPSLPTSPTLYLLLPPRASNILPPDSYSIANSPLQMFELAVPTYVQQDHLASYVQPPELTTTGLRQPRHLTCSGFAASLTLFFNPSPA
ncbi:hypothetical protein FA13DRAFT_1176598 [Coprinellus micaceus]|uniref:Uncharacterized protein n=1 Tax=Coprinellus micaceus TaxID=71717 RepID=A0A4Y7SU86_COPMI|nr:hypothetical protein FA13DRAFT_1176598 [Coprinellus micaceus]